MLSQAPELAKVRNHLRRYASPLHLGRQRAGDIGERLA
jgi:hypothetical protein